ncbi:hypothetical protein [Umezawaea beigongshangensis]|uniref:hypothetical protein n=1 Tax=Umezawaea beigongshangensis TaxID=2780383 RepID=UPI0018F1C755|nr:hypothetical protein [Umezawaea beigongshangensis]
MSDAPRPPKSGCLLNVLLFAAGGFLATVLTVVAVVVLSWPSSRVVHATPPGEEGYGVWVKETTRFADTVPTHQLWIGRAEDHGFVVEIPGGWGTRPRSEFVEGGLRLYFDRGAEVFVPESSYLGGR